MTDGNRFAAMATTLTLALLAAGAAPPAAQGATGDPDAYLEQVHGTQAMAQVQRWNAATRTTLAAQPGFAGYRDRALALLSDKHKLATPDQVIGDRVLNFWKDEDHPRGLWRLSPLAAFANGRPEWRTLLDIDAMSKRDAKPWVFKGATCLSPAYRLCMVRLSDGGGDTVIAREFDLASGGFVPGGFTLPPAKSEVAWAGADALYVGTDFGPGSATSSGYPRFVKLWRRGTPLSAARTLAEAKSADVGIGPRVYVDGTVRWAVIDHSIDFFHHEISHVSPDGRLVRSPLPTDAEVLTVLDGRLVARLRSAWAGRPSGALVAYSIPDLLAGRAPTIETVFVPDAHQAIEDVRSSRSKLWVKYLQDVSGELTALTRGADGHWSSHPVAVPDKATVHLLSAAPDSDMAFATVEGMLLPPTLYRVTPAGAPAPIQSTPSQFDAAGMVVEQHFATSKDGTRIPYFLVHRKDATGPVPTLIHAYGGFDDAQTPSYLVHEPYRSGPLALFWVEEGNAYVLANIRGGGEYGPAWHQATMREKHQNAFDDIYAVAEDLAARGVATRGRIAISGRSNGGLMASATIVQRPDLFGAAIIGSPLIDMKRYSHLLAGASWMAEYGNPDVPADWAFIRLYSPYQNLKPGVRYPVPFIYTSTEDDRVHPSHARKFAARLEAYGDPFFYDEAIEGGHEAGVVPAEDADRVALETVYLNKQLPHAGAR